PVDLHRRMMGLVRPPEHGVSMLEAVEAVDIEIVDDEEACELRPYRQVAHEVKARQPRGAVEAPDDGVDHEAEHVALHQRIEDEVVEPAFSKDLLASIVREASLE